MPRRSTRPSAIPGALFPLPDWLAAPTSRPQLNINEFARSVVASTPIPSFSHNASQTPTPAEQEDQAYCESGVSVAQPQEERQTEQRRASPLAAVRVSALQRTAIGVDAIQSLPPRTPPTFAQIHTGLQISPNGMDADVADDSGAEEEVGSRVFVEVAVYDAEAPTKSVELRLPVLAPLTQLIDALPCTAVVVDNASVRAMRTTVMLYINGVLYVDHRFGNVDYATPIARFLRGRGRRVPTVRLNERTRLLDLTVQIGVPYVLVHRGDCEHVFIFTDVYKEYAHKRGEVMETEVLWRRYPRVVPCDVCGVRYAHKFTIGDRLAETNPYNFCAACYHLAHYSQSGQLFDAAEDLCVYSHPVP